MDKKNVLLDILRPFGIVSQYAGCAQLIRAVELTLENPDAIQAVHKQIYAVIAKEYGIQPKSVESNIRTVSAVAWATDPVRLKKVAGFSLHGQPSAVEFIEIFSNYMQRKDMKGKRLTKQCT